MTPASIEADLKKRAVGLVIGVYTNFDDSQGSIDEIEQALKETWDAAIEKSSKRLEQEDRYSFASQIDRIAIVKEIRALKVGG